MTFPIMGGGFNATAPAFPVQRSVRMRYSGSAYFNRTPAAAGNRRTWTYSVWLKRGVLDTGATQNLLAGLFGSNSDRLIFNQTTNTLTMYWDDAIAGQLTTTQVFRDPSAWYHIVFASDTTQATASNRGRMYINGVQVTTFTTSNYPLQSREGGINNNTVQRIGAPAQVVSQFFDGYLAEAYFIDGYPTVGGTTYNATSWAALNVATLFGSYNIGTGVWQPIKYAGTYGTNGFYLNFQDNSAATAAAIGKDSSGNGNNWTPNGITLTPTTSASYDSMLDVPTNTSNTNANFAVMNPLKIYTANLAFSNGNLTLSDSNPSVTSAISTMSFGTSGKYYFECTMVAVATANSNYVGVIDATTAFANASFQNKGEYRSGGDIYNLAGTAQTAGATYTTNDVIGVAVDVTAGTVKFYKNGVAQGATPSFTFTAGTELWACVSADNQAGTKTYSLNFGQRPFSYPLAGFNPLCTYNLPTPLIPNGAAYMAATTYTGNGTTSTITNTVNGVSFQPDLVWIKGRSAVSNHGLSDSLRQSGGLGYVLYSDLTNAESLGGAYAYVPFNSNGFTTTSNSSANTNAATYVAWQWKASNAAAVVNTAGNIPSQVSVNTTAGFSIVTYTGNGTNPGTTIGHGLNATPKLIIAKSRGVAEWPSYHGSLSITNTIYLNANYASTTYLNRFSAVSPTTFTTGSNGGELNTSAVNYVAYCWAEVPGFSKFGSYTGAATLPFIYLGFRPRYILIKRTDATGDWQILDSSRSQYNAADARLWADLALAEVSNTGGNTDFLSNGFKIRNTNSDDNTAGGTYVYAAFAENPFNYSLAR